jgi:hypothetical protein
MLTPASPEQIEAYTEAAINRLMRGGLTEKQAQDALGQVLTKRAEELGMLDGVAEEVTPQDIIIGQAHQSLMQSGMTEKQAEDVLVQYLDKSAGTTAEIAGAIPGSLATAGIADAIGALLAAVTPTRTAEQQAAADEEGLMNLIPGRGTYNAFKRMGYDDKVNAPKRKAEVEAAKSAPSNETTEE